MTASKLKAWVGEVFFVEEWTDPSKFGTVGAASDFVLMFFDASMGSDAYFVPQTKI